MSITVLVTVPPEIFRVSSFTVEGRGLEDGSAERGEEKSESRQESVDV